MISISDRGSTILRKHLSKKGMVRVTVKYGGCAGMAYEADIVTERHPSEKVIYQERGITIITDEMSFPYMEGLNIDYSDDLISAGFRFSNKNNETSCGCGSSFSVTGFPQIKKGGMGCGS